MRFFIDNCLSHCHAQALHALSQKDGHQVVHLSEKFRRNAPDEEWIPQLASEGDWILVSGDVQIYKNRTRRAVWKSAGLTRFFLKGNWQNQTLWVQAHWLVRWWPKIIEVAGAVKKGSAFAVPSKPPGKLEPL